MTEYEIAQQIRKIEKLGTRIVSFTYHGKARNVLVGRRDMQATPKGATRLSRDIHLRNGKMQLRGVDQNGDCGPKTFNLNEISDFSCKSAKL